MKFVSQFLVFVSASLSVSAAVLSSSATKPEDVGMSSKRLDLIGIELRSEIDRGLIPGAVVAIARKGKLVYYESFGYLDKNTGTPMRKDAIFDIAAMTKPLTTVGALILYEQGSLLLNDPVGNYLPQLAALQVATATGTEPARRQPTLQDLMRHTAGFTYGSRGNTPVHKRYPQAMESADTMSGEEFLVKLGGLPLLYQPGTMWDYSLGLEVLGLTVESVSKQRLGQFLDERLFKPLGMKDTAFMVPETKAARFARPLPNDPLTGRPQAVRNPTQAFKFDCGGGCGYSTAADYLRFAEMLRNKGRLDNVRILSRKTVEFMTADQLGPEVNLDRLRDFPNINGDGFGLGVAVRRGAGVAGIMGTRGDFQWGGSSGTYFWVDPKEELSAVLFAAAPAATSVHLSQVITTLVLQAIED